MQEEKMHFTRMDQGTDEDFEILKKVHTQNIKKLPRPPDWHAHGPRG